MTLKLTWANNRSNSSQHEMMPWLLYGIYSVQVHAEKTGRNWYFQALKFKLCQRSTADVCKPRSCTTWSKMFESIPAISGRILTVCDNIWQQTKRLLHEDRRFMKKLHQQSYLKSIEHSNKQRIFLTRQSMFYLWNSQLES